MKNDLKKPLTEIKGIGPRKSALFGRLGIERIEDILYSFPREYEDRRNVKSIGSIAVGETCMVTAEIKKVIKGRYVRGRKRTTRVIVSDNTGELEILFFNAGYLEKTLKPGQVYSFFGKVSGESEKPAMFHPGFAIYDDNDSGRKILPVYPLTKGLTQSERRKAAEYCLGLADDSMEILDESLRDDYKLCGIEYALNNIHFPEDGYKMRAAKYRLIFEELLVFSLSINLMKNLACCEKAIPPLPDDSEEKRFIKSLPFRLTEGQNNAVNEICSDMMSGKRMNRLIQGDVGSGKTAVCAAGLYKVIKNGYQGALMAPTEILAKQHYETFEKMFEGSGIRTELLTASTGAKKQKEIIEKTKSGEMDLLIGTHSVFGKKVEFANLGLVVTDEQHRFGVLQREALNSKGNSPHILVMTATPIPRTLALILYGGLNISVIREKPAGRKEIITKAWRESERKRVYEFVKSRLEKGRQAYIVAPMIDTGEKMNVRSAGEIFDEESDFFSPFRTGLLHGRMTADEKSRIMEEFRNGDIHVLVSTVIVEVGINVPNASVMVIENSERFGLAQMHQLRGRVGRSSEQSYCMLILCSDEEIAVKRAEVMEQFGDGMVIAEKDLELRGSGEFFGTRQHGIPDMRIADIIRHRKILGETIRAADTITARDPLLENAENSMLRERIYEIYGELNPGL